MQPWWAEEYLKNHKKKKKNIRLQILPNHNFWLEYIIKGCFTTFGFSGAIDFKTVRGNAEDGLEWQIDHPYINTVGRPIFFFITTVQTFYTLSEEGLFLYYVLLISEWGIRWRAGPILTMQPETGGTRSMTNVDKKLNWAD